MRIKSGDMISREFPICIYLICASTFDAFSLVTMPWFQLLVFEQILSEIISAFFYF